MDFGALYIECRPFIPNRGPRDWPQAFAGSHRDCDGSGPVRTYERDGVHGRISWIIERRMRIEKDASGKEESYE